MDAFIPHDKLGPTLRADIEAQNQISKIWLYYNLQRVYSFAEVMEAVQVVCSVRTIPSEMTIAAIRSGYDPAIVREFFAALVRVSEEYADRG